MNIESLKYYIRFLGWGHTGHTLIASMLHAHPNCAIIGGFHKQKTIEKYLKELEKSSFSGREGHPYSYKIPGQGGDKDLIAIGHSKINRSSPTFGLEVKNIIPIRDPKLVISQIWRKHINRIKSEDHLEWAIESFEHEIPMFPITNNKLFIRLEEFVDDTRTWLRNLCGFIGLEFDEKWACEAISVVKPQLPRVEAPWKKKHLDRLEKIIYEYEIFRAYRRKR